MTLKSTLATDIGVPYTRFRTEVRKMEKTLGASKFFTGRNKYLTVIEADQIREHFKKLTSSSK